MKISTKFDMEQHVVHKFNGFEGNITGIAIRTGGRIEYEVLPRSDENDWKSSVWIVEEYLVVKTNRKIGYNTNESSE